MPKLLKILLNILMFALVIGAGLVAARYMIDQQAPLQHETSSLPARAVEIQTVERQYYTPRVVAYGNIEPDVVYEGKAQVSGKISYMDSQLKAGGSIAEGAKVIEIDPEDYQTSLKQAEADLEASKSQLAQLQQEQENTQRSLDVALQNLRTEQQNMANVQRKAAPIGKNTELIKRNIQLARQNYNITQKNLKLAKNDLNLAQESYKQAQGDLQLIQQTLNLANKELQRLRQLRERKLIAINQLDAQETTVLQQRQQFSQQQQQITQQKQNISQAQQQILQLEQSLVQQQQSILQQEQQLTQQDTSVASQDQSELQQRQQILQYQRTVTDLQGQLDTYTSRRANILAQIRRAEQQVKGQQTTLGRTKVTMPFDARISSVSVEAGEYVGIGNVLFEAINTDGVEVRAEVPLKDLDALFAPLDGRALDFTGSNANQVLQDLQLSAEVRVVGASPDAVWKAWVSRMSESVDPIKRTLGIVVAVDNPYSDIIVGERPPLLKGMYVQVDILAPDFEAIVIPRNAVHQGRAYVMNSDGQLEIRTLQLRAQDSTQAVVSKGLDVGDHLVVNELTPVIPGMPLIDRETLLKQAATEPSDSSNIDTHADTSANAVNNGD